MSRFPTRHKELRHRAGWHLACILLCSTTFLSACEESKTCPAAPDAAPRVDVLFPADAPGAENILGECKEKEVQCAGGETNAFGVCLAQDSMLLIPAGEFTMGKDEAGKNHAPAHKVTLSAFSIDKTEVTMEQYKACVDCGACALPIRLGSHTAREPYYGNQSYASYPAIHVSWIDAKGYCEAIGKRLPTEAEWEKAARGAEGIDYPWGSAAPTSGHANYLGVLNDTSAVTDKQQGASPYGVLNMAGNVWEWVSDTFAADYYSRSPQNDPAGPEEDLIKVMRGGGFASPAEQIRTYVRMGEIQTAGYSYLGFRCAKDAQ